MSCAASPARAGSPARPKTEYGKQIFMRLRLPARRSSPCAGIILFDYPGPRPPWPVRTAPAAQHVPATETAAAAAPRMVLAAFAVMAVMAVIAVIAVIAAAPYGLGGYCRIGLSAIAYARTIMPSRRTRRRRGHHHPHTPCAVAPVHCPPPRASTTPGSRLQRTPVRRSCTGTALVYVRTDRRSPYWHTCTDRRAGFA